jgi:signal transduction histidine kinase
VSDFASVLLSKTLRSSTLKLAYIYVTLFCSAIFALLGYAYWSTANYLYQKSDQLLNVEHELLNNAYDRGRRDAVIAVIQRRLIDGFFSDWIYLLTDPSYSYIAGNLHAWPAALHNDQGWSDLTAGQEGPEDGEAALRATYGILPDGSHLLVGRKIEDLRGLVEKLAVVLASGAALFLILAAAAGISTSRRSVARIESINATSREIMRSGLGERIPLRGTGDEWDGLAHNLNSMLDRIQELMESVRQVSDNVAHDLRTPLTRMRGRLEKGCNLRLDLSQYQTLVNDTVIELDEVLRTFSSILRISQIEMRNQRVGFRDIDLTQIAREVVELFDAAAEEKSVKLQFVGGAPVSVVADRDLLFDALSNLVDNAIKHGSNADGIIVEVTHVADGAVVAVADHGPGIPVEERKNVLKRFYRLEQSRNSPGSGLGLSLVAAVAGFHEAQIEMADNAPGLRVELHFPGSPENTEAGRHRSPQVVTPVPQRVA